MHKTLSRVSQSRESVMTLRHTKLQALAVYNIILDYLNY